MATERVERLQRLCALLGRERDVVRDVPQLSSAVFGAGQQNRLRRVEGHRAHAILQGSNSA